MDRRIATPFSPAQYRTVTDGSALRPRVAAHSADARNEIEHHLAAMRAFALILAGKRALADDIVARTVVAAWSNIDAFEPGSDLRAWLFRLLRTVHYADRSPPGRAAANDFGAFDDLLTPHADPDRARADARFRRAFDALADEQREALILLGPEGFSLKEAASVCGCTQATIRSRMKLGRRKLAVIVALEARDAGSPGDRRGIDAHCRHPLAGPQNPRGGTLMGFAEGSRSASSLRPGVPPPRPGAQD
jgi:RNA polymerase sigma-70 factor, ECF subfamily